jgi:hydroxyacylglutathione hydrolase
MAAERTAAGGTPQITVAELNLRLVDGKLQVLDVRREPEWEAGHLEDANWWPLDNFKVSPPELDRDASIAVHCKSGYRSIIASSLLQRAGFRNVINVTGGFDAWQQAKLPYVSEKPVAR